MVERLHRQLKALLTSRSDRIPWVHNLPLILLGIRSALNQDLGYTAADMVFGTTLPLPGDIFRLRRRSPICVPAIPTDATTWCSLNWQQRFHSSRCTQAFIRRGAIKPPLTSA